MRRAVRETDHTDHAHVAAQGGRSCRAVHLRIIAANAGVLQVGLKWNGCVF
jgi:hypothetical protein